MAFDPITAGLGLLGPLIGGLAGQRQSSGNSMQSWSNIDPQEYLSSFMSSMNPVYQRVFEGLEDQRQDSEDRASQYANAFSNDTTRSEFTKSLEKGGFDSYLDSARQGYIGWDEAADRLSLSAQRAGVRPTDNVWGGNTLSSTLNYFDSEALKNKPVDFARGVTSIAQQFLGRPLTKDELTRYTPNNGFTTLTQVANDIGSTLESRQRNPAPYLQALGTRSGYGVSVRDGSNPDPYYKEPKKKNENNQQKPTA